MANIKSQKKRILTNEKARQRNLSVRSELALVNAGRKLDKAVSKGVIHANNAANRKSAISKKVNAL